VKKILFV
jgi:hypothetical protein